MNRGDFQRLSNLRLQESKALLAADFPEGAYYLAGYAVECALKACIAKKTQLHEFPVKGAHKLYSHDLEDLFGFAELQLELEGALRCSIGESGDGRQLDDRQRLVRGRPVRER